MSAILESPSKVFWELKTLGESCLVVAGQSPPGKYYNSEGDGLPFYQGKKEFTDRFIGPPTKWTTHVTKQAEEGDVLMSVRAPVGPVNFSTEPICIGRGLAAIRAGDSLNKDFLFYGLLSKQAEISGNEGAVFASINKKQIEAIPFPVPPLPEQERIVAILEEAFEGIATATAHAERNLHNARELFQSVLQSSFEQKGEDWVETTLGEHADFRNGMNFSKNSRGESVKVVGVGDFQQRFWIPIANLENKTLDGNLDEHDRLREGDFLFVRSNGNKELIGRCMLAGTVAEPITHSGFTIRMRQKSQSFFPQFLCWYLKSDTARASLVGSGAGAQISNLNQGTLSGLEVPLPPLDHQKAIVQKLDALAAETRRLEAVYQRKLDALAELKQSLLHRAFAGEL